jgi:hypothetical protein
MTILTRVELAGRSLARKYIPRKSIAGLDYDPYDREACERIANRLLDEMHREPGRSPLEACQRILEIIGVSYPTERLSAAYFSNLERLLGDMPRLKKPGQLVIGLGPGRCGSTSLSAMLGSVANSCCTHETPALIFWDPHREQVDFHIKRFSLLANHYSLVSDVSHWWLNPIDRIFDQFPEAKAIGLIRDADECVTSFSRIQGFGRGSYNPWAPPGNAVWRSGHWDPTYPTYPSPADADKNPDRAKLELIARYVQSYNKQLETLAENRADRVKLVRTEDLGLEAVQEEIFQLSKGVGLTSTWRLNVRGISDGRGIQIKF